MYPKSFLDCERHSSAAAGERHFEFKRVVIKAWLALLFLVVSGYASAQGLVWTEHGPGPKTGGQVEGITDREVVGAIHVAAPHPADADILYVGSVNGGVWKTTNATAASPVWMRQFDANESLSIGALEYDPTDATNQTLVAGLGRFSSFFNIGGDRNGLLRTTDDGANWVSIDGGGTLDGLNISGVAPRGAIIVISANTADIFDNRGIWRSVDTGVTWTQISGGVGTGLPIGTTYDLVGDPSDNTRLFTNAASHGVYRSDDSGATWAKVSDAAMNAIIMGGGLSNIEYAVGTANNVFAAIVNNGQLSGLFRSPNGSAPWTALDIPTTTENGPSIIGINPSGLGDKFLSIAADPNDANIVYVGGDRQPSWNEIVGGLGIQRWPNSIGAAKFTGRLFRVDASLAVGAQATHITHSNTSSSSSPHADSRDMAFAANGDLIEVDDGGVYRRTSPQLNNGDWFSMNGDIKTTEIYHIAWDSNSNIVIAGTQDLGVPEQLLPTDSRWKAIRGGDGGDVAVDDTGTPGFSTRYSSSQFLGNFRRITYDTTNAWVSTATPSQTVIGGGAALVAQFNTPIELNNVNPNRLIIGGTNSLYESLDQGDTITEIAPGLVVNAFGRSPIAYGAVGNAEVLYVGSRAQVFVRTLPTPAAPLVSATYPGPGGFAGWIADIANDPNDPQTAFVVDPTNVFWTPDAGVTWMDITGDLPTLNPGTFHAIAYSTSNADGMVIVAANNGVFMAPGPAFDTWAVLGTGLPRAPVYDLEYDAVDEILVAGTLGRGAWTLNLSQRDPVDVVLVLDLSGSMSSAACPTCDPKRDVLKDAVELFVQLWKVLAVPEDRLAVNYFRTNVREFDVAGDVLLPVVPNASAIITDVQNQRTFSTDKTAMGGGIQKAINRLVDPARPRNIILFTDGMQNVNPMVVEVYDITLPLPPLPFLPPPPPLGASHLEIDDQPRRTPSGVAATVPPTRLDLTLSIKINTIGVGATPAFTDLLHNIAVNTNGVDKLTTAPDEDLRRFYIEELVDTLRSFSPQLVDYRHGNLVSGGASETFPVNSSARKVVLKLSWKRGDTMTFRAEKDGVDLTQYGRLTDGAFYRIFVIDLPVTAGSTVIDAGGDWHMVIDGSGDDGYEAAAIVEEPLLEYTLSLGSGPYKAGDPLKLSVKLTADGNPITDARLVQAKILKPRKGLGTILSEKPMPTTPPNFIQEPGTTIGQRKLFLLQQDPEFIRSIQPTAVTIDLTNSGAGVYAAKFTDTSVPGAYTVVFTINGDLSTLGNYSRTETASTVVRFGEAVRGKSDILIKPFKDPKVKWNTQLTLRPQDQYGNYLGPDYSHRISVTLSKGQVSKDWQDLADGSYVIPMTIDQGTDPVLAIRVMGAPLFEGPLSKLAGTGTPPPKLDWKWILAILALALLVLVVWWSRKSSTP